VIILQAAIVASCTVDATKHYFTNRNVNGTNCLIILLYCATSYCNGPIAATTYVIVAIFQANCTNMNNTLLSSEKCHKHRPSAICNRS